VLPGLPLRQLVRLSGLPDLVLSLACLTTLAGAILGWSGAAIKAIAMFLAIVTVSAADDAVKQERANLTPTGGYLLARFALVGAALVLAARQEVNAWLVVGTLLWALAALIEPSIRLLGTQAFPYACGFARVRTRATRWISYRVVHGASWLAAMSTVMVVEAGVPEAGLWCGALSLVVTLAWGADTAILVLQRLRFNARLPALLRDLAPTFALHWEAPPGSLYQITMWLDQLKRLDRPFIMITRTTENFHEATTLGVPVLHRVGLDTVGDALTPSLKTVFYVNTATRNDHLLRYPHLNHIQLNHGDSDKVASYSPVFRSYDKNFVAGQAAIDRFKAAGLATAPDFFVMVGRPQVAQVALATRTVAEAPTPTVLYAPTWVGNTADSNYTSLPWGAQLVKTLLDRGCTVIFRPHPYWARHQRTKKGRQAVLGLLSRDQAQTGREHLFGPVAEEDMDVVACFNQSDAMISDVSSMVGDYLYSEKPFAMVAVGTTGPAFVSDHPVARAAYVVDAGTLVNPAAAGEGSLGQALDAMLGADPLAAKRHELKLYYLGDIPPHEYADRFVKEASRFV